MQLNADFLEACGFEQNDSNKMIPPVLHEMQFLHALLTCKPHNRHSEKHKCQNYTQIAGVYNMQLQL